MRTLIMKVRDELRHAGEMRAEWDGINAHMDAYEASPPGSAQRLQAGAKVADLYESVAAHLEQSRLARLSAALDPARLRADAALWRAGEVEA